MIAASSLLLTLASARSTINLDLNQTAGDPLRLAFGSCFGLFKHENHIFKTIGENKPHLWAWMGDAAYTDNTIMAQRKLSLHFTCL